MAKELQMLIRVSVSEKQDFERAAEISGMSLSQWARRHLRIQAIADLKEMGEIPKFIQEVKRK